MRLQRLRLELRMKLAPNKIRMIRQLNHLHIGRIRRRPRNPQPRGYKRLLVLPVKFIPVTMPLADLIFPVDLVSQSARLNLAGPGPQPHRSTQLFHAAQLAQLINHPVRRSRIKLAGIRIFQPSNIPRILDASRLHTQANPKVRNLLLPRILNRLQHSLNPALAKPARHQQSVETLQLRFVAAVSSLEPLRLNPAQIQLQIVRQRPMHQSLFQRLIRILILHILPHNPDLHFVLRVVAPVDQFFPSLHVALGRINMQIPQTERIHILLRKPKRHLIHRGHVFRRDHSLFAHIAEERNLRLNVLYQEPIRPAQKNVRLNSHTQKFLHRVLRRLGLQLARRGNKRHQRHMHKQSPLAPEFLPHLADGLNKRQRLNIADGAANFHQHHIHILRDLLHRRLNLIGDVRNHLHRLPQIVAAPLLGNDLLVNAPGGPVVIAAQPRMRKPLVVPQIEIRLRPVVGNKHFAMLKRRHRPRIHIQIRIKLHQVHTQPAALQQAPNRCRRQTLPERRHNSARYKDVLCRHLILTLNCGLKFVQDGRTNNYAKTTPDCLAAFIACEEAVK